MSKSIKSDANPAVLRWCRENSGLSVESVAKAERLKPATLIDWEEGRGSPTLSRLRKLAKRYKRPLSVFYLPGPPTDFSFNIVKDFRTFASGNRPPFSPSLRYAIRIAHERQAWAADHLEGMGGASAPLVGSAKRTNAIRATAERLRNSLEFPVSLQKACSTDHEAFSTWRKKVETLGILIFQARGVPIEEMRGIALPNPLAPVIIINARDSVTARIFTLLHETVHLLLGESAITGSGENETEMAIAPGTETFCNRVAAETLVPEDDFTMTMAEEHGSDGMEIMRSVARRYHVSRAFIAMRMVELGFENQRFLRSVLALLRNQKSKSGGVAIPQERIAIGRYGEYFSRLAVSAFHNGEIHGGELSALLSMKLRYLPALEREVFPERVQAF